MGLSCVYTDLDGTLLGHRSSLFRDADGGFSLAQARGLEACERAGVEVVIMSGRREPQVHEAARLMGQTSYIYEAGCAFAIEGETTLMTGEMEPNEDGTIYEQIEARGIPKALFEHLVRQLESFLFYYIFTKTPTKDLERTFSAWADELREIGNITDPKAQKIRLNEFVAERLQKSVATKDAELSDTLKRYVLGSMQQYRTRYLLAKLTQHVEMAFKGMGTPGSLGEFAATCVTNERWMRTATCGLPSIVGRAFSNSLQAASLADMASSTCVGVLRRRIRSGWP